MVFGICENFLLTASNFQWREKPGNQLSVALRGRCWSSE